MSGNQSNLERQLAVALLLQHCPLKRLDSKLLHAINCQRIGRALDLELIASPEPVCYKDGKNIEATDA